MKDKLYWNYNETLPYSVCRTKWFIEGQTMVGQAVQILTFFQMNKSGLQRLITIWLYLSDRWCTFHGAFFHRRWEVGVERRGARSHLGFAVFLHAQNMFHEQNFHFISLPSVCRQKMCRKCQNTRKKKCTDLKLMWFIHFRGYLMSCSWRYRSWQVAEEME